MIDFTCKKAIFRQGIWASTLVGVLIFGVTASVGAPITWTASSEFNGTQGGTTGVWTYGRLDGVGGTFTQGSFDGTNFIGSPGMYPKVGSSFMHPGCVALTDGSCASDQGFANVRFTAPAAGLYTASFEVKLVDGGNNPFIVCTGCFPDYRRDGVRMLVNSAFNDLATFTPALVAQSFQYNLLTVNFSLAAGGTIDFSIDHNGARTCAGCTPLTRYNLFDSTSYIASVTSDPLTPSGDPVPEPATLGLMGTSVLAIGIAGRRRWRS